MATSQTGKKTIQMRADNNDAMSEYVFRILPLLIVPRRGVLGDFTFESVHVKWSLIGRGVITNSDVLPPFGIYKQTKVSNILGRHHRFGLQCLGGQNYVSIQFLWVSGRAPAPTGLRPKLRGFQHGRGIEGQKINAS